MMNYEVGRFIFVDFLNDLIYYITEMKTKLYKNYPLIEIGSLELFGGAKYGNL